MTTASDIRGGYQMPALSTLRVHLRKWPDDLLIVVDALTGGRCTMPPSRDIGPRFTPKKPLHRTPVIAQSPTGGGYGCWVRRRLS